MRTRRCRWITAAIAALTALLTAPVHSVFASASGCTGARGPASCVTVNGASTYVDSVAGGVRLGPHSTTRGYLEVGSAEAQFDFKTPVQTYYNASRSFDSTNWGPSQRVGRQVPDRSFICAWFWEEQSNGARTWYVRHDPACETVHA